MKERDALAAEIGAWRTEHYSPEALALYVKIEWINCHEHALVNTFGRMSKAGMQNSNLARQSKHS